MGKSTDPVTGSGVDKCLAAIRSMILSGELLPGQKVQQAALAEALGVSRIPVREALSRLQSEGIVEHKSNTGYTVARFNSEDLAELYLMRRLLETELVKSADLARVDVAAMRKLHTEMVAAARAQDPEEFQRLNRQFHFAIFDASPLTLVRQELQRLWYMSDFYRSLYLYELETTQRLVAEHKAIIDVVKAQDSKRLLRELDAHRAGTEKLVVRRLGRRRQPA
ncbi:GntR family transcriptional regulator [Amycolatopsis ultiminotia]|uniref:GntR family transcriptional regulator n=1 Tax=Amycolatopsis ultiminotia TaxID=543629 RepID=A0ABP6V8C7_9PSEU